MHEMRLRDTYYNYILKGTKRIELRLNDEKRRLIKIGDRIKFRNEETNDSLEVLVIGLLQYKSFDKLINDYDIDILANNCLNKEDLINILNDIYSKEKQELYGVLGIRFELIL